MEVIHPRCAGLDVHKDTVVACVRSITDGKVERTRPLCPHPLVAHYKGQGDINDAESFECKVKS